MNLEISQNCTTFTILIQILYVHIINRSNIHETKSPISKVFNDTNELLPLILLLIIHAQKRALRRATRNDQGANKSRRQATKGRVPREATSKKKKRQKRKMENKNLYLHSLFTREKEREREGEQREKEGHPIFQDHESRLQGHS